VLIFALSACRSWRRSGEAAPTQLTLMCDDIDAGWADLRARGILFLESPEERFGSLRP